jgi:prolyl oligopeptidase
MVSKLRKLIPSRLAIPVTLVPVLLLSAACGRRDIGVRVEVPPPPETRSETVVDTLHGVEVPDPYRWLEDQDGEETRQWIDAQNRYTDHILDQLPWRDALEQDITRLLKIDTIGFPRARGDRYFFTKRKADQDLAVIYLREGVDGENQVLVDPHPWSEDHSKSAVLMDVSEDGSILAYGVREGGQDEIEVRFLQVDSREPLPLVLPKARYFGISLLPDGESVVFTRYGADGSRVYHRPLSPEGEEHLLFGEGYGPDKLIFAALSEDGRWIAYNIAYGAAGDRSDIYLQDFENGGPIVPVATDLDARFQGGVAGDQLILQTNWEAPNGRVLAAPATDPSRENWREIVPEREGAVIRSVSPAGGRLFVNYIEDVKSRVASFDPKSGEELGTIGFDTLGTVGNVGGRWDRDEAFFVFSSFHVPTIVYRYDIATGEREVWDRVEIPVDVDDYEVRQVFYDSKDGTRIPMFLVHRKGLELTGDHPTLLTGYGGFNISLTPRFSSRVALWVESGGVFAVANLRGGGEYGEEWHEAGMKENKQNVFDDFLAAAEWLENEGYTNPEKLAIQGGSNGGLLVGAAMTQRPELFRAVVCSVPLLDMIRYHRFMVAQFWVSEYGSADDPDQFKYLLKYSPYHNVEEGVDYPATLFISGDGDTRVAPLHARKMTALVQARTGGDGPVMLRYHTQAGHSGGRPVSKQIQDLTDSFTFLFWQLGMEPPPPMEPEVSEPAERS